MCRGTYNILEGSRGPTTELLRRQSQESDNIPNDLMDEASAPPPSLPLPPHPRQDLWEENGAIGIVVGGGIGENSERTHTRQGNDGCGYIIINVRFFVTGLTNDAQFIVVAVEWYPREYTFTRAVTNEAACPSKILRSKTAARALPNKMPSRH